MTSLTAFVISICFCQSSNLSEILKLSTIGSVDYCNLNRDCHVKQDYSNCIQKHNGNLIITLLCFLKLFVS